MTHALRVTREPPNDNSILHPTRPCVPSLLTVRAKPSRSSLPSDPQLAAVAAEDELEAVQGFPLFKVGPERLGWLLNFSAVSGPGLERCVHVSL